MSPETKVETSQYVAADHPLQKLSVYATQVLTAPIIFALHIFFVRGKVHRDIANLDLSKHESKAAYVLYSNHQSQLDPFIICASLPLKTIRRLLPFRFFVENSYFKGSMKVFLNLMGGFPAHYEATKPYGLGKARALLASDQAVVIFPPGMRTRQRIAKPGISILATEPNTYLIPAYIDWKHRWHCRVYIGAPIKGGIVHSPEELMQYVYDLAETSQRT